MDNGADEVDMVINLGWVLSLIHILLKFLDYFVGIGSENVPTNSLLREFIGGGCFHI